MAELRGVGAAGNWILLQESWEYLQQAAVQKQVFLGQKTEVIIVWRVNYQPSNPVVPKVIRIHNLRTTNVLLQTIWQILKSFTGQMKTFIKSQRWQTLPYKETCYHHRKCICLICFYSITDITSTPSLSEPFSINVFLLIIDVSPCLWRNIWSHQTRGSLTLHITAHRLNHVFTFLQKPVLQATWFEPKCFNVHHKPSPHAAIRQRRFMFLHNKVRKTCIQKKKGPHCWRRSEEKKTIAC